MSKVSNQGRVVNNQQKPSGHTCRRRPGTSYADALALDDIDDYDLEPIPDFAFGLDDDDDLLEQRRPAKQQRSTEAIPAFATLADDQQLADIIAAMETGDDNDGELAPLEFVLLHPAVCSHAGGSVAALVLERLVYWLSPAKNGLLRARTQPDPDNPCWQIPSVAGLARQLGLATDDDGRRGEKQLARGLAKLERLDLVERVEGEVDEHARQHKFADGRRNRRLVLRLTPAARKKLRAAGVLPAVAGTPVVKVWISDVSAYGVNEAIVLGQLWYRLVSTKSEPRFSHQGVDWFRCTRDQLATETGLTIDQVRKAIQGRKGRSKKGPKGLNRRGLVFAVKHLYRGSLTTHFAIPKKARRRIKQQRNDHQCDESG